jgi:hypothetical protein
MHGFLGLGAVLGLSLAALPLQAGDFTVPVDSDFWEDNLTWDVTGKGYEFRWLVFERGGQLAVCGAGRYVTVANKAQTQQLLRNGKIKLDGRTILTDLSFFTKVMSDAGLASATATCRDTGAKAVPNSKVSLDISGRARF